MIDTNSASSNNVNKRAMDKSPSDSVMTEKQKSVYDASSATLKMMYKLARTLEGTVGIPLPEHLSHEGSVWITKKMILEWIFQEEIEATHISVFIGYVRVSYTDF